MLISWLHYHSASSGGGCAARSAIAAAPLCSEPLPTLRTFANARFSSDRLCQVRSVSAMNGGLLGLLTCILLFWCLKCAIRDGTT